MATAATQTAATLPTRITVYDLARFLGRHPSTVSRLVAEGTLPAPRRIGRSIYWLPGDLPELLGERKEEG